MCGPKPTQDSHPSTNTGGGGDGEDAVHVGDGVPSSGGLNQAMHMWPM